MSDNRTLLLYKCVIVAHNAFIVGCKGCFEMSKSRIKEIHGVKVKAVKGSFKQGWGAVIQGVDGIAWGAGSMKKAFADAERFIERTVGLTK